MQLWNNVEKGAWAPGPWQGEPDKAQWVAHGLDCLIVRGPLGALCGYVGVPASHPYFEKDYGDCVAPERHDATETVEEERWHYLCTPQGIVTVHGGLTFAALCRPEPDPAHGICHVEEGAANKVVWWFGFDCAHYQDLVPQMRHTVSRADVYRDFAYVKGETESLAEQLAALAIMPVDAAAFRALVDALPQPVTDA